MSSDLPLFPGFNKSILALSYVSFDSPSTRRGCTLRRSWSSLPGTRQIGHGKFELTPQRRLIKYLGMMISLYIRLNEEDLLFFHVNCKNLDGDVQRAKDGVRGLKMVPQRCRAPDQGYYDPPDGMIHFSFVSNKSFIPLLLVNLVNLSAE